MSTPAWNDEHGPDELYDKFRVIRVSTGEEVTGQFIFTLLPETDEAACAAIVAYADACEYRAPNLAAQLRWKVAQITAIQKMQP